MTPEELRESMHERIASVADAVDPESPGFAYRYVGALITLSGELADSLSVFSHDPEQGKMAIRGFFQLSLLEELAKAIDTGNAGKDDLVIAGTNAVNDLIDAMTQKEE